MGADVPTYFRAGNVQVRIYNGDHNPPHCHIVSPNGELQIALSDCAVIRGTMPRQEYDLAIDWIRATLRCCGWNGQG